MDRLEKDQRWLTMCMAGAIAFSTCAKKQFYAIIVDSFGYQIGSGYNGVPKSMKHCYDGGCPRLLQDSPGGSRYENCNAIHAESNALLHSDYSARRDGGTMYINGPPCFSCAKLIANSGLDSVVFIEDNSWSEQLPQIKQFLSDANIYIREYDRGKLSDN